MFSDDHPINSTVETDEIIDPQSVFMLSELIETETLARFEEVFSRLCDSTVSICDVQDNVPEHQKTNCKCLDFDITNYYAAPVTWNHHILGYVILKDNSPEENTREFVNLIAEILSTLCHQRSRIRQRVRELTAVYDLGGLFAGSHDLGAILNIASKRICDVMNVKAASIRLLDRNSGELVISGMHNLSDWYLSKGRIMLNDNPIDKTAFSGEVVYIEDARTDPRVRFPEHTRKEGLVSGLACPMTYRGNTVGILRIYSGKVQKFSKFDVELLRSVASQACGAIINSRLYEESKEAEEYTRNLKRAGQIQRRMIPSHSPEHSRVSFGQVYMPSLDVGGDFFDFLRLPKGNIGLAIADVVGKGLPGALMMASVRSALRAHARGIFNIDEIISQVNRHLCRDTLMSEFATLFYGVFSPHGSRFTYCNAGHNPPLLLRNGQFTALDTGGMVIGVIPDTIFERAVLELQTGDVLVFYTDGVTEAMDYNDNLYTVDRLKQSILRYQSEPAATLANQLLWDVRRFAGLSRQTDDITIVIAKVG